MKHTKPDPVVGANRPPSELVNEVVKPGLVEDADDLAAFERRANEPELPFETVVKALRHSGKI